MPATVVSVAPATIKFGDIALATVQGNGTPSFAPFVVRGRDGNRYVIQCLDPKCVPPGTVKVGDVTVRIVPRATGAEIGQPLRSFARETARLPTSYRVSPTLVLALLVAAALACLAAAAFVARPLLHRLVPEPRDARTPLERALALVRASATRNEADRRRALDLLGRALRDRRARDALDLAWSAPDPTPADIEQLVERVER
jgi:hypothetical protein